MVRYGLSLAMLFGLAGCSVFGALLVKPGQMVTLIAASSNQITYEYTHHYDSESEPVNENETESP
jgi:hypothetical protein